MSARNLDDDRPGFKDSYANREDSFNKSHYLKDGASYEKTMSESKSETKRYPTNDSNHYIESKEYRYETKDYPIDLENKLTNGRSVENKKLLTLDKDGYTSEHNYENIEYNPSSNSHQTFHSSSFNKIHEDIPSFTVSKSNSLSKSVHKTYLSKKPYSEKQISSITMDGNDNYIENPESSEKPVDPSRVSVTGSSVRLVGVHESAEFLLTAPQSLKEDDVIVEITGGSNLG